MRIAITGGSGFIGRGVVEHLRSAGHDVLALGRRPPDVPGVRFAFCDLLEPGAAREILMRERASHLVHLAWVTEPQSFWRAPHNLDWVAASLHLARAFVESGGERIVVAGTCAEYAWQGLPCDADASPLLPQHLYGVAKDALRRTLAAYLADTQVSFAWGRVFFVYGPGEPESKLVSSTLARLQRGEALASREPQRRLDFVYVDDVARAFALLATSSWSGPVNVASGSAIPVGELLRRLARQFGREIDPGTVSRTRPDVEAILSPRAAFGYEPLFDIDSGLAATREASVPKRK